MKKGMHGKITKDNPFQKASLLKKPLILDGAMGSFLQMSGYKPDDILWFSHLSIEVPDAVLNVHKAYIDAGADIITTNTFRTNPAAVQNQQKYSSEELISASLRIARKAVNESPKVMIAGSNPPAEDSYQKERVLNNKDLFDNHIKHINLLMENGCDFVLNETQSHFDEIKIICEYCSANHIPFVVSLFFDTDLKIFSGESVTDVADFIYSYYPLAVGFNCVGINQFANFLKTFDPSGAWGFYLNYGTGRITDTVITSVLEPHSVDEIILPAVKKNVSFTGGCCGSCPEHISYIRNRIYENDNS